MSLKNPVSYYGGKAGMLRHILPLIPSHGTYVEPFIGGASVFWAKEPSPIEVINDLNGEIVNFYRVMQTEPDALASLILATAHSRQLHVHAALVYRNPDLFDPVRRAWAVWVQCNMSFASIIQGGYAYGKTPTPSGKDSTTLSFANKRDLWANSLEPIKQRLRHVQIECNDALQVIRSRDSAQAFHYIDPPYIDSEQGHYRGYTPADFEALLALLATLSGRFMLSCYDGPLLRTHAQVNAWQVSTFLKPLSAQKVGVGQRRASKTEVLVANYTL